MDTIGELSESDRKRIEIFFSYALEKQAEVVKNNRSFVHYTSAEVGLKIIQNEEVWMRRTTSMNDYSEVSRGLGFVTQLYDENFQNLLDSIFPNVASEIEQLFNGWIREIEFGTYITCFSEHVPIEDEIGRLSMWRAYGKGQGIAIVVNSKPFMGQSDALKAYSTPVAYLSEAEFDEYFITLKNNIAGNKEFLQGLGRGALINSIFETFRTAAISVKHPGFIEEKEWRMYYAPKMHPSERIKKEVVSINGIPQEICKIPLKDVPDEGLTGIELDSFIERIIIGPTTHSYEIWSAFVEALKEKGITEPEKRVVTSDIPFRP